MHCEIYLTFIDLLESDIFRNLGVLNLTHGMQAATEMDSIPTVQIDVKLLIL